MKKIIIVIALLAVIFPVGSAIGSSRPDNSADPFAKVKGIDAYIYNENVQIWLRNTAKSDNVYQYKVCYRGACSVVQHDKPYSAGYNVYAEFPVSTGVVVGSKITAKVSRRTVAYPESQNPASRKPGKWINTKTWKTTIKPLQ